MQSIAEISARNEGRQELSTDPGKPWTRGSVPFSFIWIIVLILSKHYLENAGGEWKQRVEIYCSKASNDKAF